MCHKKLPGFAFLPLVVQQLQILSWEKDFLQFCFLQQLSGSDFFREIYFLVCSRFSRCCRSWIVRESIKVYFGGIACSLNRDLNFKRLLFKWRTRRDPPLWKRHHSLSLYHYLLTAGLNSGQISKSICPRFHSENREKEKRESELFCSQRKEANGKEGFVGRENLT